MTSWLLTQRTARLPAYWAACLQASPRTKTRPLFRQHTNSCSQTVPCPQPLPQNRKLTWPTLRRLSKPTASTVTISWTWMVWIWAKAIWFTAWSSRQRPATMVCSSWKTSGRAVLNWHGLPASRPQKYTETACVLLRMLQPPVTPLWRSAIWPARANTAYTSQTDCICRRSIMVLSPQRVLQLLPAAFR